MPIYALYKVNSTLSVYAANYWMHQIRRGGTSQEGLFRDERINNHPELKGKSG